MSRAKITLAQWQIYWASLWADALRRFAGKAGS